MPLPAAEGIISLYQDAWRDMLAKCARVQSLTQADTEAEAKKKILRVATEEDRRPWILLGDNLELVKTSVEGFVVHGSLYAMVELPIPASATGNPEHQLVEFHNDLGQIMDELKDLVEANTDGSIDLQTISRQGTDWGNEDDGEEYLWGLLVAEVKGI